MTNSIVRQLILKDWRLNRLQLLLSIGAGMMALGVILRGGEGPIVAGTVWFFIALILVGTMLPISGIVNERKKQNLAFLMSLPVSSIQYTTAKLISTVGMFLVGHG
jgi:ABC-2 type transport system permease protein